MLSFFPTPYPDELLYSVLARYHVRSGSNSPKLTLKELFDDIHTIASVDLPSNLEALAKQLSLFSQYTADSLIANYTLYPLYAPFITPDRAVAIKHSMKAQYGGDIHTRIGIAASSIPQLKFLRFCPHCNLEDEQKYGEIYWHRIHQMIGVLVCPYHGAPLQDSTVLFQGMNRHEYEIASSQNCQDNKLIIHYSSQTLKILTQLAQDVAWLLQHPQSPQSLDWYRQRYLARLIERNLAIASKRVYQKRLNEEFIFFYGREILESLNCTIANEDHNWLSSIVRKNRQSFHPIRHILMMRFLSESTETFFGHEDNYKPFGNAPWICFNGAFDHYLQPVVTNLKISHCLENKKPLGTFTCSCGMIYSRTHSTDKESENENRPGRVIAYGALWENRLRELVEVERSGLRFTARTLKVDTRTINRYVDKLKLQATWQSTSSQQKITETKVTHNPKDKYRQQWLTLQNTYPDATKTVLRKRHPALYAWFYRNDKEWLNDNSPVLERPSNINNRVNWSERDIQFKHQAEQAVAQLLSHEVPDRITVSKIGAMTGLKAIFERHLDKLPLTKAYFSEVTESVEMFQDRRVQWAIAELERQGEDVITWKVMRLAGMKEKEFERVDKMVLSIQRQNV